MNDSWGGGGTPPKTTTHRPTPAPPPRRRRPPRPRRGPAPTPAARLREEVAAQRQLAYHVIHHVTERGDLAGSGLLDRGQIEFFLQREGEFHERQRVVCQVIEKPRAGTVRFDSFRAELDHDRADGLALLGLGPVAGRCGTSWFGHRVLLSSWAGPAVL